MEVETSAILTQTAESTGLIHSTAREETLSPETAVEVDQGESGHDDQKAVSTAKAQDDATNTADVTEAPVLSPAPNGASRKSKEANADKEREELKGIALRLYNEEFLSINAEEYTQFLASLDADSVIICDLYMSLFKWNKDLLKSTRMLCLKLHLKGESQEIDRILSAFTRAYIKQHPDNIFCTQDFEKIYIILYSLILLNTNLHNAEVGKKSKISEMDYVGNTLTTFLQQNRSLAPLSIKQRILIEKELHTFYADLAREQLFLKTDDSAASKRMLMASKRFSVAETVLSSNQGESDSDGRLRQENIKTPLLTQTAIFQPFPADFPPQSSAQSVQLSYADRRSMSMVSKASAYPTTHLNSLSTAHRSTPQTSFGFTRALTLEVPLQRASVANTLRAAQNDPMLGHRSSRGLLMTKDSRVSLDRTDNFSLVSLEDSMGFNIDFEAIAHEEEFNIHNFQDRIDLKLELQGSPYLKEGLLKLKIFNNDNADTELIDVDSASVLDLSTSLRSGMMGFFRSLTGSKSPRPKTSLVSSGRFQKPTEYFVVVSKGELRLYSFDPKVVKKQQRKKQFYTLNDEDLGDGNWLKNAAHVGTYNLCSTVARIERIAGAATGTKPTWMLIFPKVSKKPQKRFVFEAGTAEVATEFVNTCNFWASKITAVPPLEETVSSIEYGWTDLEGLQRNAGNFKKMKSIGKWEQLPRGVYFRSYAFPNSEKGHENEGIMKQFLQTLKYYNHLKALYTQFARQKVTFVKIFRRYSGCANYTLVLNNYEQKAQDYKAELTRYKSYIIMLAYGLKLRLDLEEEEESEEDDPNNTQVSGPNSLAVQDPDRKDMKGLDSKSCPNNELKMVVVREINKLLNTSSEMNRLFANDPNYTAEVVSQQEGSSVMVKSPKNFSISNLKDFDSSPIKQLLSIDNKPETEMTKGFSTTTINEEEEPEEEEPKVSLKQEME